MLSLTCESKCIKTANVGENWENLYVVDGMPSFSKVQGIPALNDPLNGSILPANMTNADGSDKNTHAHTKVEKNFNYTVSGK